MVRALNAAEVPLIDFFTVSSCDIVIFMRLSHVLFNSQMNAQALPSTVSYIV